MLVGMSNSDRQASLEERVIRAAEAALSRQQYVSAIDVFCGMGLLLPMHVDSWRKGRVDYLERVIQGNLHKISSSMAIFRHWAQEKGLKPSETGYGRKARSGTIPLQFSKSGDPAIEQSYRTHYISPALSERKLVARMAKQIGVLFPGCPAHELATIAEHTAARGSERVGRTEAGRNLEERALTAAVIAAVRHKHTEYDELLQRGMDRASARETVAGKIDEIVAAWRTLGHSAHWAMRRSILYASEEGTFLC